MEWWQVLLLSMIEGLTEFLPISSTGHLIIASHFMGLDDNPLTKSFNIIIQFGAILSVLILYRDRLRAPLKFYLKIFLGFFPAALLGLMVKDRIDALLGDTSVVCWALILGGGVLIFLDQRVQGSQKKIEDLTPIQCLLIGLSQCLAFIPGVSRAAASIVGGLFLGLSKREAAEFSFFLAVPTLAGAGFIKTLKVLPEIGAKDFWILATGVILSFLFATIAIKFFMGILNRHGFLAFGIYRIALGTVVYIFT